MIKTKRYFTAFFVCMALLFSSITVSSLECFRSIDVVLVFDRSTSMETIENGTTRLDRAKSASTTFFLQLNDSLDRFGLVSYATTATLDQSLTSDQTQIVNLVNGLAILPPPPQRTNIGEGIRLAQLEIFQNGRLNATKIIVLLTDGAPNEMVPPLSCVSDPINETPCTIYARDQAHVAEANGTLIYTIGIGVNNYTQLLLQQIATTPQQAYLISDSLALEEIYDNIIAALCPCGNGVLDIGEQCDDGNNLNGDGCDQNCSLESYCGDGIIDGLEQCDDGNQINEDGCNDVCQIEFCGDNILQSSMGEICEMPNTTNNPYCIQSTQSCFQNKTGSRDAYGNCDSSCGCVLDPINYQCVAGVCGASCTNDDDCDDNNLFSIDSCNQNSCQCEYVFFDPIIKDAKVSKAMPQSNFGFGRYMMVNPKQTGTDRSYLRIDITPLTQIVNDANLLITIYYTGFQAVNSTTNVYYCPNHDFDEGTITWVNQPLDSQCFVIDTFTVTHNVLAGNPLTTHNFDLTGLVNQEILSGDKLFTIVLVSTIENTNINDNSYYIQYLTKEYPDEVFRPRLIFN